MSSKSITIAGSVHAIGEVVTVGAKGFQKREVVVLVEDGKYPQHVPVEFTGDKINDADGYRVGDSISIEANVRGREWRGNAGPAKYFLSLSAWRVDGETKASKGGSHEPAPSGPAFPGEVGTKDDVPW